MLIFKLTLFAGLRSSDGSLNGLERLSTEHDQLHAQTLSPAASIRERWPWGSLRIGAWLLPSVLALTVVGFALAVLITTAAALLLGRNPLLPLALAVIGAALFLVQGLWGRRGGRRQRQVVFPSLLLFAAWSALLWFARLPLLATLDLLSLGLALQLAIGRLGCTLAGCCYGLPASWGFLYPPSCGQPPAGVRRLPVPLLEASGLPLIALSAALALALAPAGTALALLLLLYGLLRSALEPLRGDPSRRWRGLRPAQPQAAVCSSLGLLLSALARQKPMPAVLSGSAPSPVAGASWAAEIIPRSGAGMALRLLGLVAAFWLLWHRDLWAAEVRHPPEERRRALEVFARSLRTHPPSRQQRVHQLGDLELADCRRLGSGEPRTWQISVQRQRPPLCRAEAEWTLEVITAELSDPLSHPPMVMAGPMGLFLIELPEPQGTRSRTEDAQHLPPQTSDYFLPLMPAQSASTNAHANGD